VADDLQERCAILHHHLVSKGLSEKHARMAMNDVIPLLKAAEREIARLRSELTAAMRAHENCP
jgi:hypothetical protein